MSARARRTTAMAAASTALLAAFAAAPPALASSPHTSLAPGGYAATGGRFTSVSASWVQPAFTCVSTTSAASFWVGLDGVTDSTVEQTGTEVDCSGGSPVYHGWYELLPSPEVIYSNPVSAGDLFDASVTTDGSGGFTLTLTDATQGWSRTTQKSLAGAALSSAEVMAEVPSGAGAQALPDRVSFTSCLVDGAAIGKFTPEVFDAPGVTTSALTDGENFDVTWTDS